MDTRYEYIDSVAYCVYCGKILDDQRCVAYPKPPLICNCEKAKEELKIYDNLKRLYREPLAEKLVEIKVNKYRNKLLGIKEPIRLNDICSISTADYPKATLQAAYGDTEGVDIEFIQTNKTESI